MRLEQHGQLGQAGRQVAGGCGVVGDDIGTAKFDAGLHDKADNAHKGSSDSGRCKGMAMLGDSTCRIIGGGHGQMVNGMGGTTGNGHLGADDIDGRDIDALCFGHGGKAGIARSDHMAGQGRGVTRAGHAAIEVNLGEPGLHIGGHHGAGPGHGICGGQMSPWIGAKMIAAENQVGGIVTFALRNLQDKGAKGGGGHAGIAAVLIDLIAGRLDQHGPAMGGGKGQSRTDDVGMGRTDRRDTTDDASAAVRRKGQEGREGHGQPPVSSRKIINDQKDD